ncbi:MAG: GDP-mannose 4,6-dehydratase [Methanoregula sp.]|jgi:GDP-4-dehydro-6-deoxy-D-mannose reductase
MNILITGASGFTGKYLIKYLASQENLELFGLLHNHPEPSSNTLEWIKCNLRDKGQVERCIHKIDPERIIHLAGLNSGSIKNLIETNVLGTENLLHAINRENNGCRILVIGSSAEYGYSKKLPIDETASFNPVGGYGISKVAQDLLARSYYHRYGLQVAVARPFNLIGPGQSSSFVCGQIVSQIVEIETGLRKAINLHEIKSCRDFIDVRDTVRAYWSILDHNHFTVKCAGNAFNVGSGKSYAITEVLEMIWEILGEKFPVVVSEKHEKLLIPSQQSDNSLIITTTGWRPHFELKRSLTDMLLTQRELLI